MDISGTDQYHACGNQAIVDTISSQPACGQHKFLVHVKIIFDLKEHA